MKKLHSYITISPGTRYYFAVEDYAAVDAFLIAHKELGLRLSII